MPKLYTAKQIIKLLEAKGFIFVSQKGSHAKYRKKGRPTKNVIVPIKHKEIPMGTFRSILRQANLDETDFE
ncbi:MAG: putative RNA binding protein YcfA (HicA-like mRNA interferase family) [Oceanicoccus sp.]|jgi:predicted RNA binding protein YcfA (HicA-like mRNA interferase family)